MFLTTPFETELWIWALSSVSGLYWTTLRGGLDDMVMRMSSRCEIQTKA